MCTYQTAKHREIQNSIIDLKCVPLHLQAALDASLETEFKKYLDDTNTTQTWKWQRYFSSSSQHKFWQVFKLKACALATKGTYSKIAVFFQNKNCYISIKWNKKPRGFDSNLITVDATVSSQSKDSHNSVSAFSSMFRVFVFPYLDAILVTLTDCRGTCQSH